MANIGKGTRILVVDDEKLIRITMSAQLKRIGYMPVAVPDVDAAVALLKENPHAFSAIVTDIVMGDMDGFVFRDIVRGIAPTMPIFFLTGLDPEEGGGFLKRILDDPISYYLPKRVHTDVILKRMRQVVASKRVEQFIADKVAEDRKSQTLAAHIQHSMLPVRMVETQRGFYTTWWQPADIVSGDLYEAVPFGTGCYLYVLGDIQGHGTSAALVMTAVQSFLKNFAHNAGAPYMTPADIANMLQKFFRANLAEVSYMTALICIHRPLMGDVIWLSCGAPDLVVIDDGKAVDVNPERKGGLPIGMLSDTIYSESDVVHTPLSRTSVCIGFTDGLMDLSRDDEGLERLPMELSHHLRDELVASARAEGSLAAGPAKYIQACRAYGYDKYQDDVTILVFGARLELDGIYATTIPLNPDDIDRSAQDMGDWCREQGWPEDCIGRVQLVLEEKLMNVYDHGFDDRDRLHEVVSFRLRKQNGAAVLTVWDTGTEEPSIEVATGDSATAFEIANMNMSDHGRGRLMVRELCRGIERNRYVNMNETIFHVPFEYGGGGGKLKGTAPRA